MRNATQLKTTCTNANNANYFNSRKDPNLTWPVPKAQENINTSDREIKHSKHFVFLPLW